MVESILSIIDTAVYYKTPTVPVKAVDGVSFNVFKEEIFGITGESGCGKSTLALAITKLLKPPAYIQHGRILFNDTDILKMPPQDFRKLRWKKISYIPQSSMNALNPIMKVEEQIGDVIQAHEKKISKNELKRRAEELLSSVGLAPDVAHMYPHELSGGMKQRTVIATSVALTSSLIIADEPTTALDVVVQRGILQLLGDIKGKFKTAIILITHDMAVQAQVADRLAIMYAGKIVEMGDVSALFRDPLHPYTQALILSIPSISEKVKLEGISGLPPDLRSPPPGCRFQPRCPHRIPDKCNVDEPQLVEVKKNRFVACHLYGDKK